MILHISCTKEFIGGIRNMTRILAGAQQAAEKVLFVIPSEARDLLFFSTSKKKQIPRANTALRNDMVRVFPQPVKTARRKQICDICHT